MTRPEADKSPARELSPRYALMGFLYFQPMHGYELHRHLENNLREVWRVSQSQAYGTLKRLEREGLVVSVLQPQEKRPDRACFSLTGAGRDCFETWLYTPTPSSARAVRMEFVTRLFFAAQISADECSRLMQQQAGTVRADLERLQQRLGDLPEDQVFNRLGLELRVRQMVSILDWLESCELNLID